MGFRYRKSFKLAPGVRMTISKSGVGYSVGRNGLRVTKRADGRVQSTLGLPGTGLSYTSTVGRSGARRTGGSSVSVPAAERELLRSAQREAAGRTREALPMPRRIKRERILLLVGLVLTVIGPAVPPLLLLAVPALLVALVMMLVNLKRDMAWARDRKDMNQRTVLELLRAQLQ